MKATFKTNATRRTVTTLIMLAMVAGFVYGQGILAEGAAKLFRSIQNKRTGTEFSVVHANYNPADDTKVGNFRLTSLRNVINSDQEADFSNAFISSEKYNTVVLRSFKVSNIDIAYENELKAEDWMRVSFDDNLETAVFTEEWMTEPFSENLEGRIEMEDWMAIPFSGSFEEDITAEEWMNQGFYNTFEAEVTVENWMTEPFIKFLETEIEVEDWMTTPLFEEKEEAIVVENWMTQPFV